MFQIARLGPELIGQVCQRVLVDDLRGRRSVIVGGLVLLILSIDEIPTVNPDRVVELAGLLVVVGGVEERNAVEVIILRTEKDVALYVLGLVGRDAVVGIGVSGFTHRAGAWEIFPVDENGFPRVGGCRILTERPRIPRCVTPFDPLRGNHVPLVVVGITLNRQSNLPHIGEALRRVGLHARFVQGRQKNAYQHGDDSDHHQQLN